MSLFSFLDSAGFGLSFPLLHEPATGGLALAKEGKWTDPRLPAPSGSGPSLPLLQLNSLPPGFAFLIRDRM